MTHRLRPTTVSLLCAILIGVALSCRSLSPEPGLVPSESPTTVADIFPTETSTAALIPTDHPPFETPEPTPTNPSGVIVTSYNQYYEIFGNDAKELRKQLDQLGPRDPENDKVYDASVMWQIEWKLYYQTGDHTCKIDQAAVFLTLTYLEPQWNPTLQAKPAVVEKWNNYLKNLSIHQGGHADVLKSGAQNIYQIIMEIPPAAICETLAVTVEAAARQGIEATKQADRAYDKETSYGKTQEAVFP